MNKKKKGEIKTNAFDTTSHYLTVVALLISNLSVLMLGVVFSSQLGQGMGDVAAIGDQLTVEKSLAAVRRIGGGDGGTADPTLDVSITFREPGRIVTGLTDKFVGNIALTAKNGSLQINAMQISVVPPDGGIAACCTKSVYKRLLLFDRAFPFDIVASTASPTSTASTTPDMNIGFQAQLTALTSIVIQKNQTREFALRADFETPTLPNTSLPSGAGNALRLSGFDVVNVSNPSTSVTMNGLGATFNTFSIVKARSQIHSGPKTVVFSSPTSTPQELHKMWVYQENTGPGAFAKLSYRVATSGVDLIPNTFSLYVSRSPVELGERIAGNQDTVLRDNSLQVRLDVGADDARSHTQPGVTDDYILGVNQSYYFTLLATVRGSGSVTTELLTDTGFARNWRVNVIDVENSGRSNFIWSDLNFDLFASSTATNNVGWFNGFRLFP